MKFTVWRGHHSPDLQNQIAQAWKDHQLLFVGSHSMKDVVKLKEQDWQGRSRPVLAVLTSGTTSSPRFVFYTQENIESALNAIVNLFDQNRIDTIFCYPQPYHTFGLTLGYVLAMLKGWKLVSAPGKYSRNSHALRATLKSERVLTLGTPVHFLDLRKYTSEEGIELTPTYSAIIGGAPVSVALWRSLKNDLHIEAPSIGYGCTEASPGLTHLPPGQEPKFDSEIGYPLASVEIDILPQRGLEFSGPNACIAMEQGGELVFQKNILIQDKIEVAANGSWTFQGRYDLVMNSGGQKLSLEKIEKSISQEFKLEALCVAVPDERLGEELALMICSPMAVDVVPIIKFVSDKFEKRLSEKYILIVENLPLNVSGKLDRREAANQIQQKLLPQNTPPKTQIKSPQSTGQPLINFPLAVSSLEAWTPHRGPMIWVNDILSATREGGESRVLLNEKAYYMTEKKLRLTSLIEFIAQSYAYLHCTQTLMAADLNLDRPKRAFLVGTRDTQFFVSEGDIRLKAGQALHIKMFDIRRIQTFILFRAEVLTPAGELIMSTTMKLFHD